MTGVSDQDPRRLSEELEKETDELERHSSELEGQITETRQDWERKRRNESIPGAPAPEPDEQSEEDSPVGAEEKRPGEARREG